MCHGSPVETIRRWSFRAHRSLIKSVACAPLLIGDASALKPRSSCAELTASATSIPSDLFQQGLLSPHRANRCVSASISMSKVDW